MRTITMATIINTKLGTHRGRRRIWLEGQKLAREGYAPGMRFNLDARRDRLVLSVADEGQFKVSRRTRSGTVMPIIDLTVEQIAALFDGVDMLRVAIKRGRIVITAHHQQQRVTERNERFAGKLSEGKPLEMCSLFHGGGVLDAAFHAGLASAGVESVTRVAVEMDGRYLDASLRNNPQLWDDDSIAVESPVQAVDLAGRVPQVDILVGGVPCTGASRSGVSKNKLAHPEDHESAGALFFSFLEFIKAANPALVVLENVPEYQKTASMSVIRSVLATLGYTVQERVLDGHEFGALEQRRRLCAVAVSNGLGADFDISRVAGAHSRPQAIRDILESVPDDSPRWKAFSYLADKAKRDKAAGKGFARQLLDGSETSCGTIGRGYAKCRSTEPFLVHPSDASLSRIFTPIEHARIKGIPETVVDGLSDTVAHEVLGQSVVFPVFRAVGQAIGQAASAMQSANMPATSPVARAA